MVSDQKQKEVFIDGGVTLTISTGSHLKKLYFDNRAWEEKTTEWFRSSLKPETIFYDIGANVGYYSLLAASIMKGSGRVIAFEPNPHLTPRLRSDIDKNNLQHLISLYEVALSQRDGTAKLYLDLLKQNDGLLSSIEPFQVHFDEGRMAKDESLEVSCHKLDSLISEKKFPLPDIIKIDVEGHEYGVLTGMLKVLQNKQKLTIIVETTDDSESISLIRDEGFTITPLDVDGATFGNYLCVRT